MRINVVGRHFEVTDAIRAYAQEKAGKLTKYYTGLQQIDLHIAHEPQHHGAEYEIELVLDVEKHADFVSHSKTGDPYEAIDLVVEKGERQLRDFKEKLKG
jgi:putative sigma-54 modulation protein